MPQPLVPARLAFASDGTPYSEEFGDVYHSAEGGLAQARHVFLAGNGLPERWRDRRQFTILETGFGFGLSFLASWQAWRGERLHFVSIERHPFQVKDLEVLLGRFPELKEESTKLLARWPMLVPGMHRLAFDDGKVTLTLFFGDIAEGLPQLQLAADAIFLDGFSPAKNPAMWEPRLLRHLGRLAAPGCTVATWSVASTVRAAVEGAGFAVEKRGGFGLKKEMLVGRLVRKVRIQEKIENKKAIVIGAGVAGAAVSERLASRGWQVTVLERHRAPAEEASGNPAGVFHPIVSPDDSLFARYTRASYLYLLQHWPGLAGVEWRRCGVLQKAREPKELASQQRAMEALGYPADYARFDPARGGIWFAKSGWVKPKSLVHGLLRGPKFGVQVQEIRFANGLWHCTSDGGIESAPVLILANAADALRLAPRKEIRLRQVRGQLTFVPALAGLDHVLLKGGMALPGIDGNSVIGASYDIDDPDTETRADSHAGNLARLEEMLPGASTGLDPEKLAGRVAFRAVVRDRLPLVGPLGEGLYGAFAYGSRGLLWASLAGELIASQLEGEPLPMERSLAAAVAPERFLLREKRKRPTAGRA